MTRSWVKTIVISKKLGEILAEEHGVCPFKTIVLPDAAPDGLEPAAILNRTEKTFMKQTYQELIGIQCVAILVSFMRVGELK